MSKTHFIEKLKNLMAGAGIYLLYLIGASFVTMLCESLICFIVDKFIMLSNYFALSLIRLTIYTIGMTAIIGFLGYYEGYRTASCPKREIIGSYAVALVPYTLLSALFNFHYFIAGGVRSTTGIIFHGTGVTLDKLTLETPDWLYLLVFLGYCLLYGLALVIFMYFGAQKRICDRAELRKNEA